MLPKIIVRLRSRAGKFQGLDGNDGQQAEKGDEDDEGQDQASEDRGQIQRAKKKSLTPKFYS